MTDWKPGTLAAATVRGHKETIVFRREFDWITTHPVGFFVTHEDRAVTDVRPLVVLDVPHPKVTVSVLRQIAEYIREKHGVEVEDSTIADDFADQIEAQTKPPRIPEPGPWGVVRARLTSTPGTTVWTAVRLDDGDWRVDDGGTFAWDDLIDPTLIREGVEA